MKGGDMALLNDSSFRYQLIVLNVLILTMKIKKH